MKRSKFKLLLSGVIIIVLLLLGISASFGVYYKQYTTLMKMYADQYASLTQYQKSECSNEDPNPTYSVMLRYHPIDNMRLLSNVQSVDQAEQIVTDQTEYIHHQKIYQIKTLPAKHALTDTSSNQKYNLTHHHIEKISSTSVKEDIDNIILFRSDGSINILTYEEYLQEEESIKNLSDEELGFEKFDTEAVASIERHQHLGALGDRPSLYVSGSIYGHIKIGESLQGNIVVSDSLTGDITISNNLVGDITITESLNGHFSAKTITLENVADGKAAINVGGDINSVNDGIHVQGLIKSTNGNGINVGGINSVNDGIHIEGSIQSTNGNGINVGGINSVNDSIYIQGSIQSTNGNGINIENGGISAKQNAILITKPNDETCQTEPNKIGCENVIQGGVGTRQNTSPYTGTDNYAAINITGNIYSGNDTISITGDVKSKWYSGIHIKGDVQIYEKNQVRTNAYGIHIEGNVLGYNGGINVSKQVRSISGRAAIHVGKDFRAISGNDSYSYAIQGAEYGIMSQNGIRGGSGAGIYINGDILANGSNGYGIHIESGSITSRNSAFSIHRGNLISTGSMATINISTQSVYGGQKQQYGHVQNIGSGKAIQIDGDIVSNKNISIHVGRTVQSGLDGIVINGVKNDDGIKTAISSENGYALNISGNINAAGGLLVQDGNITTNGKYPDSSDEPYAGVRMKCVQDPETNKCIIGGYIITKDAFGVQLEGGVQTTIAQGKGDGIRLGDVEYLKFLSSDTPSGDTTLEDISLGTAIEIGNVVSDGSGVSIQNISTQDGPGISAQHVISNGDHAITALTATSTYAFVDSSQGGSDYPSVIQVRRIETDSPDVEGIRVSKVSTDTGIAIHVYETNQTDEFNKSNRLEPGIISSKGIGIQVGDKTDSSSKTQRIETTGTSIRIMGDITSSSGSAFTAFDINSKLAAIAVSGKIISSGNGVSITNGIQSSGIGLTITSGGIDSAMDAIRIKQKDSSIPAIRSVSQTYPAINITGDVLSTKQSAIVINGGVITKAYNNLTNNANMQTYYGFKADYIDASQSTSSSISQGPYGIHVGWIKSYNTSINITGAEDTGLTPYAIQSNSTVLNIGGDVILSRPAIQLTNEQKQRLQTANEEGPTELTKVRNEIISELSSQGVINVEGNLKLDGFDTTITVYYNLSNGSQSTFNSRFSPIAMINVGKDIETADSASVTTDGIIIGGSVKSNGGNCLVIGGDVSGTYGVDINGVMKSIKNSAIRINNTNNEVYAINSQNGLLVQQGSVGITNYGISVSKNITIQEDLDETKSCEIPEGLYKYSQLIELINEQCSSNGIFVKGDVLSRSSSGQAIRVLGNVQSGQTPIYVVGNVNQTSSTHKTNAIYIGNNIISHGYNAIHVQKDIIGASSGILVNGMIKTNATSWNCSNVCDITNITEACEECIQTTLLDGITNTNYNNILRYIPAAINVNNIVSEGMGYGIYVQNSINTTNDSIRIDNRKTTTPPITSTHGNGIVVNSSNINQVDITRKNAIISKQSAIHIEGDLITSDAFDTVHLNGVVQNDFIVDNQNSIICYNASDLDQVVYKSEDYLTLDEKIAAIYVKEIYTKQTEIKQRVQISDTTNDIPELYDRYGQCYRGGNQQGVYGIITEKISTFNDSILLQTSVYSKANKAITTGVGADIYGRDGAINLAVCTSLRANDTQPISLIGASLINENSDDTSYSLYISYSYINRKTHITEYDEDEYINVCPAKKDFIE